MTHIGPFHAFSIKKDINKEFHKAVKINHP